MQPNEALFTVLSEVPQAVGQLLRQLQDGSEPATDIGQIMLRLEDMESTEQSQPASVDVVDVIAVDEAADEPTDEPAEDTEEAPSLMELFIKESGEHLQSLAESLSGEQDGCEVTESMFRSLHTLAGISELVEVPGMRRLIEPLYAHFGALHHEGKAADSVSTTVLQDSVQELCRQHEQSEAALHPLGEVDSPGKEKDHLDVEEHQEHGKEIVAGADLAPGVADGDIAALVRQSLYRRRTGRTDNDADGEGHGADGNSKSKEEEDGEVTHNRLAHNGTLPAVRLACRAFEKAGVGKTGCTV